MSLKPYMKYKNTGLAWIGEIPDEWKLEPISKWFQERRTTVSEEDYPALSVTKQGVVPQLSDIAFSDDTANRRLVMKGDFVINSRSDRKGSSGVAPRDGSVSLINTVLASRGLDPSYTQYLLKSQPFQEEFYRWGHGIVADLWSTNWSDMKSIKIPVPDSDTQACIARYLDRETSEIDAFIAESERLIELLNERRTAAITQAVTKGLNPHAPMKDSGVSKRVLLRRLVSNVTSKESGNTSPLRIGLEDIQGWTGNLTGSGAEYAGDGISFQPGDVLFGKLRPNLAKVWLANEAGEAVGDFLVLRPKDSLSSRFLAYSLLNLDVIEFLTATSFGSKMPRTSWDLLSSISIPDFPLDIQEEIADFLDRETVRIETAIATAREAIALARERRQALISAAVTGKIDVRNAL